MRVGVGGDTPAKENSVQKFLEAKVHRYFRRTQVVSVEGPQTEKVMEKDKATEVCSQPGPCHPGPCKPC